MLYGVLASHFMWWSRGSSVVSCCKIHSWEDHNNKSSLSSLAVALLPTLISNSWGTFHGAVEQGSQALTQHTNTLQSLLWELWHPTTVKTSNKCKISHDSSFQLLKQVHHMYKIPGRSYGSDSFPLIFSLRNIAVTNRLQNKKIIIIGPLFPC